MKQVIYDIAKLQEADYSQFGFVNVMLLEAFKKEGLTGERRPKGFFIAANAFEDIWNYNFLDAPTQHLFTVLDKKDPNARAYTSAQIQELLKQAALPFAFQVRVLAAYQKLSELSDSNGKVRLICSPVFRKNDIYLKPPCFKISGMIKGEEEVLQGCKKCYASLFRLSNLEFMIKKDIPVAKVKLSIGIIEADEDPDGPIQKVISLLKGQYGDPIVA